MFLHKLQLHTGLSEEACRKILAEKNNDFWEALYDVCKPEHPKSYYLEKLVTASEEEALNILETLENFYYNRRFTKIEMNIIFEDEELLNKIGKPKEVFTIPENKETEIYVSLLLRGNKKIISAILEIIKWFPVVSYTEKLGSWLKKEMISSDWKISNELINMTSDNPAKINFFFDQLKYNLNEERDMNHFNAVRSFWSENADRYEEIIPRLKKILDTSENSQVKDMASDILVRYEVFSEEEVQEKITELRKQEIKKITEEISGIKEPEHLHFFADIFNWDNDLEYLKAIVLREDCLEATAKLIYWRSRPVYFLRYSSADEVPSHEKENYHLQLMIIERMGEKIYKKGDLSWNPSNDDGYDWTVDALPENEIKKTIPAFMY